MKHRMEERELLRLMAELPREIQPQNDPWEAISARIAKPRDAGRSTKPMRGWTLQAAAASVVLALLLGLFLGPRLVRTPAPGTDIPASLDDGFAERGIYQPPEILAGSEAEYQAAFREFIGVGDARSNLSPQTIETIEAGWADLREAESALTAALAANPDDRFLSARMLELRARQLGFLQELAMLDQSNRRLTT